MKINRIYAHYIPIASMSLIALVGGCNYSPNIEEAIRNNYRKACKTTHQVMNDLFCTQDSTVTDLSDKINTSQTAYSRTQSDYQEKPKSGELHRPKNKFLVKQAEEARERIRTKSRLTNWEKKELRNQARIKKEEEYEKWFDSQPDSVRFRDRAIRKVNSMMFHPDYRYGGTGEDSTYGRWIEENWSKAKSDSVINHLMREYAEEARQDALADSIRKSHLSRGESEYTVEIRAKSPN